MRYGRIGTKGQARSKKHADEDTAATAVGRLIAEKEKKGYREQRPALDWSDATPGWRPPEELPALGIDEVERHLLALRTEPPHTEGWSAARQWLSEQRSPVVAQRLAEELSEDAFDLGASSDPPAATTAADQRRQQREAQDLYAKRYVREQYLKAVLGLLAADGTAEAAERLVVLVTDQTLPVAAWAAQALASAGATLSDDQLERLLELLDHPVDSYEYGGIIAAITRILVRQRPDSAFDVLQPHLRGRAVHGGAGRSRAGGILGGVGRRESPLSRDWAELVLPLIRYSTLASRVFETIAELPGDDESTGRVIAWLEKRSTGALQTDGRALTLLANLATPQAVPILSRAVSEHAAASICLEGLRRIDHPDAAAAIARHLGPQESVERFPKRDRTKARRAPKPPQVPALDDQRATLLEELRGVDLEAHASLLIQPSIRFIAARDVATPFELGTSKLGGAPDLPPGTAWPEHDGRPLAFVGQIDLADVAPLDADDTLPSTGLLSFFVMDLLGPNDTDHYLEVGRVMHFEKNIELRTARAPEPVDPFLPCRLHFHSLLQLRSPSHPRTMSVLSAPEQERYDAIWANAVPTHQLLGPRDRRYDGERGLDDVLLLQCMSDPHPDMQWGDSDALYFYIPADALRRRAFDEVSVLCGD